MARARGRRWLLPAGVVLLTVLHAAVAARSGDWGQGVVLWCANLFALVRGAMLVEERSPRYAGRYAAGYLLLAALVVWVSKAPLLFAMFAFLYAGLGHRPYLLGYLGVFVFSIIVITPYWAQAALLLSMVYAVVMAVQRRWHENFLLALLLVGAVLLVLVALPILYMVMQTSPQTLLVTLKEGEFGRALITTLVTSSITTLLVLVLGVPLAYVMARTEFPGKQALDSMIDIPILIPQSVVGIALLVLLGPKAPVGQFLLQRFGMTISGTLWGIVACQLFVSSPFLIRSALNSFEQMGPRLEHVSRTLGAPPSSTFFRISLPLASRAIFAGAILTWARAISETGSLMIVAYHPFTVSVLAYDTFTQYGLEETRPLAILLVLVCLWVFVVLRWMRDNPPRFLSRSRRRAAA